MGFISDFKAFALKGNVLDLAVGVIIGGAFGKIVTSMVDDIIMPLVGLATHGQKFTDRYINLSPEKTPLPEGASLEDAKKAGANILAYGQFTQNIVDFLIIAICIFIVVRSIARLYKKKEAEVMAVPPTPSEALLTEIRDLLRTRQA